MARSPFTNIQWEDFQEEEAGDWVGEGREREMGTIITALHKYKGQR